MTVISTVFSRSCVAHASDSFITERKEDGELQVSESKRSKIVKVRQWRGAMAYWGLAKLGSWSTWDWLNERARLANSFASAEEFAVDTAEQLEAKLRGMRFARPTDRGIGIHFSAYERRSDYWIPELFLISNWSDVSYSALRSNGVGVSRETYHSMTNEPPGEAHGALELRLRVHEFLQRGNLLIYNNGDPVLFNAAANGMATMFIELARRGLSRTQHDTSKFLAMARRPVEIVTAGQRDFCQPGKRLVGGKAHDLAITPDGGYSSTTGDAG
jgi:hypothetical protein